MIAAIGVVQKSWVLWWRWEPIEPLVIYWSTVRFEGRRQIL